MLRCIGSIGRMDGNRCGFTCQLGLSRRNYLISISAEFFMMKISLGATFQQFTFVGESLRLGVVLALALVFSLVRC